MAKKFSVVVPPETTKRKHVILIRPNGPAGERLHKFIKKSAAIQGVSMEELCRQMLRHCANELGFDDKMEAGDLT